MSVLQNADWTAENITLPSPWASGALEPKETASVFLWGRYPCLKIMFWNDAIRKRTVS